MKREHLLLVMSGSFTWLLVAYSVLTGSPNSEISFRLQVLLLGAFLLLFLFLSLRKSFFEVHHADAALMVLLGLIPFGVVASDGQGFSPILWVIWAALLPSVFNQRAACFLLLLSWVGFYLTVELYRHAESAFFTVLIYAGFQAFSYFSSLTRKREEDTNKILLLKNQELSTTKDLLSQHIRNDEKLRIARDLHDSVGYKLTALSLQLEAAKYKLPEVYRPLVSTLRETTREILEDLRCAVTDLRIDVSLNLAQTLKAMQSYLPGVTLELKGHFGVQSIALAEQLLLVFHEAINNAIRHGNATHIQIVGGCESSRYIFIIKDNGNSHAKMQKINYDKSFKSIRERLAFFNGTVTFSILPETGAQLIIEVNSL